MASAETPSTPAAVNPNTSTQSTHLAHIQPSSEAPAGDGASDPQNTEPSHTNSLFGPFPPTTNPTPADHQIHNTLESRQTPLSLPPDQIETANETPHIASSPGLNFNPQSQESTGPAENIKSSSPQNLSLPPLVREKTAPAIGPATDKPTPVPKESETEGPALYITLLLSSTGARHPYRLDEKYLRKRNVIVDGNNPINISLYKLKELILRDWREEWEVKPSSPESIRLISMGKMLNDKARLCDSGFTNGITPHIIHMTIKPQEMVDEEDAKMKATGSNRGEDERSPGCRCIIQ